MAHVEYQRRHPDEATAERNTPADRQDLECNITLGDDLERARQVIQELHAQRQAQEQEHQRMQDHQPHHDRNIGHGYDL
jgi:hypothetical protein